MGTITKALSLLNYFSERRAEIGLASFVRLTGRDKATVRRHLVELEKNGFLEQSPTSHSYRLGPAILRLSGVREISFPVGSVIAPIVDELAMELGELVHASLLQGSSMSTLYHADPQVHGTHVIFDAAELLPLHATASGLAMLAFGPPELREKSLSMQMGRFTAHTVVALSDLEHMVDEAKTKGYSYSPQLFTNEIHSFAMPVLGADGYAVGTIAVPVPQSRLTPDLENRIVAHLKLSCERASRSFGFEQEPAHLKIVGNQQGGATK